MKRSGFPETVDVSGISFLIPETTILRAFQEKLEHRVLRKEEEKFFQGRNFFPSRSYVPAWERTLRRSVALDVGTSGVRVPALECGNK